MRGRTWPMLAICDLLSLPQNTADHAQQAKKNACRRNEFSLQVIHLVADRRLRRLTDEGFDGRKHCASHEKWQFSERRLPALGNRLCHPRFAGVDPIDACLPQNISTSRGVSASSRSLRHGSCLRSMSTWEVRRATGGSSPSITTCPILTRRVVMSRVRWSIVSVIGFALLVSVENAAMAWSDACKPVRACAPVKVVQTAPVPVCKPVTPLPPVCQPVKPLPPACKPVQACERVDAHAKLASARGHISHALSAPKRFAGRVRERHGKDTVYVTPESATPAPTTAPSPAPQLPPAPSAGKA